MFPLPRVLYAMANDGILFKFLKRVHPKTHTPALATMLSGLLAAIMALVFNLQQLIDMMSIGTLMAYTIVAVCVLVLRYQNDRLIIDEMPLTYKHIFKQMINFNSIKQPNHLSSSITKIGIVVYSVFAIIFCAILGKAISNNIYAQVALVIIVAAMLLIILIIARQPIDNIELTFKVPMVPLLPCLSVLINLYLMFQLDVETWIRFVVWIAIGKLNFDLKKFI